MPARPLKQPNIPSGPTTLHLPVLDVLCMAAAAEALVAVGADIEEEETTGGGLA